MMTTAIQKCSSCDGDGTIQGFCEAPGCFGGNCPHDRPLYPCRECSPEDDDEDFDIPEHLEARSYRVGSYSPVDLPPCDDGEIPF